MVLALEAAALGVMTTLAKSTSTSLAMLLVSHDGFFGFSPLFFSVRSLEEK